MIIPRQVLMMALIWLLCILLLPTRSLGADLTGISLAIFTTKKHAHDTAYFYPRKTGSSCTSRPLGMTDGSIRDWQLAASSAMSRADDAQCAVKFARLHMEDAKAWCAAKKAVNEWVLVDLGVASEVTGIVTQGRGDISEWVTHFMVSYSLDAYKWEFARDIYGNKKVSTLYKLKVCKIYLQTYSH